jgi:hypothetical protein
LKYDGSSILTSLIIVSTVSEFNIVWKDADGAYAVSSIAIEVVVSEKSSPVFNEK